MPIKPERRWWYPIDWPIISNHVRFQVDGPHGRGRCWTCGRPHGHEIRVLPDGRWFDPEQHTWRDDRGREASWPDVIEACAIRKTRVILAACHRNHRPEDVQPKNLAAWCQRHHMLHDREFHRAQARITILLRRAAGDPFQGPYRYR
ncbi:hypothetical protein [Azospirillum brasilense]|uniref:Uncharacterized protein n=1 Tax=Azospirillum brasilense TaxID=192 RepID=A0A6L3AR17_AZOBR|nr:hypothetical protein [Azospirillum brasilense]KAA0676754.1 hypothetical protein DS837_30465 [Azospirillum brasilense]